jgi:hypothetical protein
MLPKTQPKKASQKIHRDNAPDWRQNRSKLRSSKFRQISFISSRPIAGTLKGASRTQAVGPGSRINELVFIANHYTKVAI